MQREVWEEWSRSLITAEGRAKMFSIAKQMTKDEMDVDGTHFIKSDTGEIKVRGG